MWFELCAWGFFSSFSISHSSALYHLGVPQHFYSADSKLSIFQRLLWTSFLSSQCNIKIFTLIVLTDIHTSKSKICIPNIVFSQSSRPILLNNSRMFHQHHKLSKAKFVFIGPLSPTPACLTIYTLIPDHSSKELRIVLGVSLPSLASLHMI